jgi:hypothetical protein
LSTYLDINELQINDREMLVEALREDMKFQGCLDGLTVEVESHELAQSLIGFQGDTRPETAEVIVRRKFAGMSSNDLGFKRQESGNFKPIISGFDNGYYNSDWRDTLSQRYSERKYAKEMYQEGFILQGKTTLADGTTDMQFVQQGIL